MNKWSEENKARELAEIVDSGHREGETIVARFSRLRVYAGELVRVLIRSSIKPVTKLQTIADVR